MSSSRVSDFLLTAFEASIYVSPESPGLTLDELDEAGDRLGIKRGEIRDTLGQIGIEPRIPLDMSRPSESLRYRLLWWNQTRTPEPRNERAFEFIYTLFDDLAREHTRAAARVERSVLANRGKPNGISEHDMQVAITALLYGGILREDSTGLIGSTYQGIVRPSLQTGDSGGRRPVKPEFLGRLMEVIKDIVKRRSDGRPAAAEPIAAFERELARLGHDYFESWWRQTAAEFRTADANLMPTTVVVLAATLCEGALVFIMKHAQHERLSMPETSLGADPKGWKFDKLVDAACKGAAPVFSGQPRDQLAAKRAKELNFMRHRIHAGRVLDEQSRLPHPDLRPEEARTARETTDLVLRRVLDWLEAHPA